MRKYLFSIVGLISIVTLDSCNLSKIEDFELGRDFVESNSGIVMIDTMNVLTSTVLMDSTATSKLTSLLAGGYRNSFTGTVTSSPYFEINNGSYTISDDDLIFDSLVIRMNYNHYFIGDTTHLFRFNIRQLAEKMELRDDGNLYNNSKFQLSNESLGEARFYPQPHSTKNIYVRLADQFGRNLFDKIINKNDTVQNSSTFKEFFKGVALISKENENSAAIGFSPDSMSLRVYYHEEITSTEVIRAKTFFSFPFDASGIWYNKIDYNSKGSLLETIDKNKNELSLSSTSNQIMVQAGSSIYTKIRIPGISRLKGYGKNLAFVGAKIVLTPLMKSYSTTNPLPDSLAIYNADLKNRITSQLSISEGQIYAIKVKPAEFDQSPYYVADLTAFFTSQLANPDLSENSILVGTVPSKSGTTINPVAFGRTAISKSVAQMSVYCYIDKGK